MRDLRGFREAVREHRRAVGRTQQQLARSIGLHPDVLSHKLNGRDNAVLTIPEIIGIVTTLAGWGALTTRAEVRALLDLMAVPPHAIPAAAWSAPPLATLRAGEDHAGASRRPHGPATRARPADRPPRYRTSQRPGRRNWRPGRRSRRRGRPGQAGPAAGPATALIGRECERAEVAVALTASRLVTLTGTGGTGKTRLALQAAHDVGR